jgi:hypothetical protein
MKQLSISGISRTLSAEKLEKFLFTLVFTVLYVLFHIPLSAQTEWPLTMAYEDLKIQIFKPETETFNTNKMSFRSALMVIEGDNNVFGSIWVDANLQINQTARTVTVTHASVNDLRFPDGYAAEKESGLIKIIEKNLYNVTVKMDDILSDLENSQKESSMSKSMNNNAPVIYYTIQPSILVTIDGDPILQATETKDVDMIMNTPFLILKHKNIFYLCNGSLWYESRSPLSGWTPQTMVPGTVVQAAQSLKSDEDIVVEENSFYPEVIVSTVPAELIQTDGAPTFAAIPNTMMLYITNTSDQIVMDIRSQQYFVLLSGRWYASTKLDGQWQYIDFANLPADFAKIPEGSAKDVLLASVPETKASRDAVRESLVPQAAVVDRSTTKTEVVYDGEPDFENIEGTNMRYAVNSSGTVISENNTYYVVDNGVWFVGTSARGPWIVSDRRPVQINIIPPSCPAYNARYVYVYHSTPQVVYVGYTRGYLSSYVVGPVVVYGTGHRYRPWRGRWYYPRPCTWGFGMLYNPWYGWSVNYVYGSGWFGYSYPHTYYSHYPYYAYRPAYRYRSGWWGPPVYRPPYCVPHTHYYGRYQAQVRTSSRYNVIRTSDNVRVSSPSRNNNIYTYNSGRGGVQSTRSSTRTLMASSSGRQNLTRSYSSQARPVSSSSGSRTPSVSTRPSSSSPSNATRNPNVTSGSRGSSGSTGTSNSSDLRNPSVTTRPSSGSSSGTRNPSTTKPSSSSSSPATRPNTSNSPTRQSTTQPSRSNSSSPSSSTTRPNTSSSGSSSSPTRESTTQPSRSNSNSSSSPTTRPNTSNSGSSNSPTRQSTTQPSRSNSSSSSPATRSNTSSSSPNSSTRQSASQPSRSNSSSPSSSTTRSTETSKTSGRPNR